MLPHHKFFLSHFFIPTFPPFTHSPPHKPPSTMSAPKKYKPTNYIDSFVNFYDSVKGKQQLSKDEMTKLVALCGEILSAPKPDLELEDAIKYTKMVTEIMIKFNVICMETQDLFDHFGSKHMDACLDAAYDFTEELVRSKEERIFLLASRLRIVFMHIIQSMADDVEDKPPKFTINDVTVMVKNKLPTMTKMEKDATFTTCFDIFCCLEDSPSFGPAVYAWLKMELDVTEDECNDDTRIKSRVVNKFDKNELKDLPLVRILRAFWLSEPVDEDEEKKEEDEEDE